MMESAKQISVFLENKPGRLAKVLSALAKEKVNVTALTVMDSHDHGVLRVVTSDVAKTAQILSALNTPYSEADVLLVELKNNPGALAHVCEKLAADHINIDYCYASSGGRNGKVQGVFKVTSPDRAAKVLNSSHNNRVQSKPLRDRRIYTAPSR